MGRPQKRTYPPLTAEQQQIVIDNHNLIMGFAQSMQLDIEEFYDLLAIALCKAAIVYDPSRNVKFSTLAYRCMANTYKHYKRIMSSPKRIPECKIVSYDAPTHLEEDGHVASFLDVITSRYCRRELDITTPEVKEFRNTLPDKLRITLDMLIAGYKAQEIAPILGVSRQRISMYKSLLRDRWLAYTGEKRTAS